jgi:FlaA1/EpsC-like NDP-sugar epimerase
MSLSIDDERTKIMKRLERRAALVTGAASGIGKAIAVRLADEEPRCW